MIRIFHNTNYEFIRWWRVAAGLTMAFIVAGLVSFAVKGGVNYSIEFTGGTLMQLQFKTPPDVAVLRSTLDKAGITGAEIQQFGTDLDYTVRARDEKQVQEQATVGAEGISKRIEAALVQQFGIGAMTVVRTEAVGPKVGSELRQGAVYAMIITSLFTLMYLAFRFDWRFGVAAVVSTAHDILVTFAFIKILHIEVSLTVVAAILTLLGYSANDTIIIFDRVRENLRKRGKGEPFRNLLDRSINETLPRSIMTHATVLAATLALLVFAGEVIRPFAWVMTFGVFVATFSSIYVAGPVLLWIEGRYPRATTDNRGKTSRIDTGAEPTPNVKPRSTERVGTR